MREPGRSVFELGDVRETLLIPLYGRAVETGRRRAVLRDHKAVEMVAAIDYDFARLAGTPSLYRCVLRTSIIDGWVRDFVAAHPGGTVIEIGTGLNTRFERVDSGRLSWIDLDLPEVIAVRRAFFADTARRRMVACSVLDEAWVEIVAACPGPYFFAAEAVLVYLDEPDVRRALGMIAGRFPGAHIATDTASRWIVDRQDRHDLLSKVAASLTWVCDRPRDLEGWELGLRLVESRTLATPQPVVGRRWPLRYRLLMGLGAVTAARRMRGYRLNRYHVAGA